MRRLLTLAACVAAIGGVAYVQGRNVDLSSLDPWGIGVVFGTITLAVVAGELSRLFKLPRVHGYVAVGLLAVSYNANLIRPASFTDAINPLHYFDEWSPLFGFALALTGLSVGLRTDLSRLGSRAGQVATYVIGQIAGVAPVVALIMWWASTVTPFTHAQAPLLIAIVALLASTSSLTAMYAVNSDMRADGRLPEMQMLVGVVKNTLVGLIIVALVLVFEHADVIALAQSTETWIRLGAPVVAGLVMGATLLLMLRRASSEVVLVAYSAAAVGALLWANSPIAVFFSFLIAGSLTGSLSRFSYQLGESLDRASPFFLAVVFVFVFAGTELPLTFSAWSLALLLMALRGIGMFVGSRTAGRLVGQLGGEHLPYSMFSQSLATLFAVGMMVEAGVPDVDRIAIPLVVLDVFFGTLLHRFSLVRSGFASELENAEDDDGVRVHRHGSSQPVTTSLDDERSMLPAPVYPDPDFRSEQLNRIVHRVRQRMLRAQDRLAQTFFDPRRDFVEHIVEELRDRLHEHVLQTFQALREVADIDARKELARERRFELEQDFHEMILVYGPTHEPGELDEVLRNYLLDLERACHVDAQVRAPEEDTTRDPDPNDDLYIRLRKRLHATNTRFGPRPMRVVPVRALALHHLAHGMPAAMHSAVNLDGRFRIYVWQRIANAYDRVGDLYQRMLNHLDEEEANERQEMGIIATPIDEEALARESEELAEFEQRLRELARTADELSEQSDADIQPMLAEDDSGDVPDVVLAAWSTLLEELGVDFDDLERDVFDFEADVRRRVALTSESVYRELLRDLGRAGTYALPARRIDPTTRQASAGRDLVHLSETLDHWGELAHAFVDRRLMFLGYRELETKLRTQLYSFIDTVETELSSHLTYYPAEISERCDDVVQSLSETFQADVSDADLIDAFVQIRHNLSDFLQEDALHSVQELRETALFAELIRRFTDRMEDLVRDQRSLHIVADESYLDRAEATSVDDVEISEIPFQDLLERHLVRATLTSFNEVAMRVRTVVDNVASGLGEVNRVISFNLDAAIAELRPANGEESNRELVAEFTLGGIRRAGDQAAQLLEQVKSEVDAIDHQVLERTLEHVRTTKRLIFDESMGRLEKLALEVDRDRSKLQRRSFELLEDVKQSTLTTLETVARPARVAAEIARDRLSLEEYGRDELLDDVGHASFEWSELSALPLAYRRLFTPNPVEIPELYVTREKVDERLDAAIRRFREGRRVSIVVSGDLGTGKTSFVHRVLAHHLNDVRMIRWNVRERITTERQLLNEINRLFGMRGSSLDRALVSLADLDGDRVVVVDGIERLFLRTIRGSNALRDLMSFVSQSPPNVLWLLTCNSTLWQYLCTMQSADDFLTDVLELEPLDAEQTEELVMRRHRVSGYTLEFGLDETEQIVPKAFAAGRQARLRKRYFKRLHEATHGHPLLSLYYWLSSLEAPNGDTLVVRPLEPLRTDHLRRLSEDKLIGLGQLVLHEELSQKAFADVMRMTAEDAQRDLAFFEALNLVSREPGRQPYFRVNEVLYHDIERALLEHNIV